MVVSCLLDEHRMKMHHHAKGPLPNGSAAAAAAARAAEGARMRSSRPAAMARGDRHAQACTRNAPL